jgi:hypothetical protein
MRKAAFDQNLHDALRGAPQRERVARPGRHQPDLEAAPQRVDLVRKRKNLAGAASMEWSHPC